MKDADLPADLTPSTKCSLGKCMCHPLRNTVWSSNVIAGSVVGSSLTISISKAGPKPQFLNVPVVFVVVWYPANDGGCVVAKPCCECTPIGD
jgi:hypothetical protein